jgi:hypothetical protein
MIHTIGFDAGNSEATLTTAQATGTRGASLTIPSYLGSGSLDALLRIRGGIGEEALGTGEIVLAHDGREMFVGDLALAQASDADAARGDVSRYWTGHTRRLLLALAGSCFKRQQTTQVRIVTGLPVAVWSKETVAQVRQSLAGVHRYRWNGLERTLVVEGVMVVMEGAGALVAHGSAEPVPQGVIDVGGRTTDLFWAQGMKPMLDRCDGLAAGVEKAGDLLARDFARGPGGRTLAAHEVRALLRATGTGQALPPLYVDGKPADLDGHIDAALRSVADEIGSFVARTWRTGEDGRVAADAARVLLIGGGAHYFAKSLRGVIPHLEVPKNPELANAQGYLALGLQIPIERWAQLGTR